MPRLWRAVIATVVAALGLAPAAHATVTSSQVTSWVSSHIGTPPNSPYLIYVDNPPATTLTVSGNATETSPTDTVDLVCFSGASSSMLTLASNLPVHSGTFKASALNFQKLAGHPCRLRAVPHGSSADQSVFAGPQLAVSEAESVAVASGPNAGKPYGFYLNGTTLTGVAAWSAAGTPSKTINTNACGGPNLAPVDSSLDVGAPALDCAGALLADDVGAWGGRSEVQIDGRNAYDAASAQALFGAAGLNPPSQNLAGFPSLTTSANWDPDSGLISSHSNESWVACNGPNAEDPTYATCPSFTPTGVQLQRALSSSDGGRVVTMTDTWSSTDNAPHTLDLLYDDYVGILGAGSGERGFEFPGQSNFSQYGGGDAVPAPSAGPGSIFVRTNITAPDGDPNEAFGAITFSSPPSGLRFAAPQPPDSSTTSSELEERNVLQVPGGGSVSLTYIYSVAYTQADVTGLALDAQDRTKPLALTISSPASGATVSTPTVTVEGTATAGSGVTSLVVGGQNVPVGNDGTWSTTVPLRPGSNVITALVADRAGATAQGQLTIVYQPPAPPPLPPPPPQRPAVGCRVPRLKTMKLPAAERALRVAHCQVGRIKRVSSRGVARGRVISTTPVAGRRLPAGAKVQLFVSKGPGPRGL